MVSHTGAINIAERSQPTQDQTLIQAEQLQAHQAILRQPRSLQLVNRPVTDAYLLIAAVSEGGRFVSFDQRIPTDLVPQARPDQLVVIGG